MKREEFLLAVDKCIERAELGPWCYISGDEYEDAAIHVDERGWIHIGSKKTSYNIDEVEDVKYRGTVSGLEPGELCNYVRIRFKKGDMLKMSHQGDIKLMVKVDEHYYTYRNLDLDEYLKVQEECNRFDDFFEAFHYLTHHPANCVDRKSRELFEPGNHFFQCLGMAVVKVNPENVDERGHCISELEPDKMYLNTKTEIWLEYGKVMMGEDAEVIYCNDVELDCGGDTFEEAIIKLANLLWANPYYRNMEAVESTSH